MMSTECIPVKVTSAGWRICRSQPFKRFIFWRLASLVKKSFPTFSMFLRDPAFHLQALVFDKEFDNALKSAAKSGGATPEAVLEFENVKEK